MAIASDSIPEFLEYLCYRKLWTREAAILVTCNRTEIYCRTSEPENISQWLANLGGRCPKKESNLFYTLHNDQVVNHAFRVASGLDSMIIGEPEILGQMKKTFHDSQKIGTIGPILHRLFERAFSVAKKVRTTTGISQGNLSIPMLSMKLVQQIFPNPLNINALYIGSGDMIEASMAHMSSFTNSSAISNRTLSKVLKLANKYSAETIPFEKIGDRLGDYDFILSSTSSQLPIIGKGMVERALKKRKRKPIMMVDLAVPRDIESEVNSIEDIFLYTLDDFGEMVSHNSLKREEACLAAENIIETHTKEFMQWLQKYDTGPTITQIRKYAEDVRQREMARTLSRFRYSDATSEEIMEEFSKRLTKKLIHPTSKLLTNIDGKLKDDIAKTLHHHYMTDSEDEPKN